MMMVLSYPIRRIQVLDNHAIWTLKLNPFQIDFFSFRNGQFPYSTSIVHYRLLSY